ncbi:MAG: hypothetical protein M1820_000038 [Bogoriella megaspora]|nr:MAG: hypothetical protein M1820_000038 [Bogoriella megaspora]
MILKNSESPRFGTKRIKKLWKSHKPDLAALEAILPGSVLVALDIESSVRGVGPIQAYGIQIRDRVRESALHETTFFDAQEAGSTVQEILSQYGNNLMLIGFALYNEVSWISQEYPYLTSSLFAAWVDVQDIAFEQSGRSAGKRSSLWDTLTALDIKDYVLLRILMTICNAESSWLASNPGTLELSGKGKSGRDWPCPVRIQSCQITRWLEELLLINVAF